MNMFKKLVHPLHFTTQWKHFIAIAMVMTAASFSAGAQKIDIDKAIALVDDDIIFASELEQRINFVKATVQQLPNERVLRERALEALVTEKLQLSVAERNKVTATSENIEQAINGTKENLARNGSSLDTLLEQQGLTYDEFIERLKIDIILKKIQQAVIQQRTRVGDREIDNFLASKEGQEWLTPRYQVGHIFLPYSKNAESKVTRNATKLYERLLDTRVDFRAIAQRYSKGPNANKGGELGLLKKSELPDIFVEQVLRMEINDTTAPFTSPAGIHILRLFDRRGAKAVIVDQYKVRHILVKPTELFTLEEAEVKINQLYYRIKNGEDFVTLAQENTDDVGSKLNGGELGWSKPGAFVPAFEKTMIDTPVGDFSQPFQTQFGWHILWVEDKRQKDIFEDVKRNQVSNILGRQRFQDELQVWLKELRDRASVELLN